MSTHSYSRCWLHVIWETLRREPMVDKRAAAKASENLYSYSHEKGIYMKINYFNADHTHALIDLPTNKTIEQVIQFFKGGSSHWINESRLIRGKFAWGEAMGHSQSHIQTQIEYVSIYPSRHSIIEEELSKTSITFSLSDTVW